MHLSSRDRAEEVLKRSRSLVIDGVKFALPRHLKRLIYYDKVYSRERFDEKSKKWISCVSYRPCEIYRLAMACARERNSKSSDFELRKHPGEYSHEVYCGLVRKEQARSLHLDEVRKTFAEQRLQSNRQKDTY